MGQGCFDYSLFNKIYRNDGIYIKQNILSNEPVCDWLEKFQSAVDNLTGSHYRQFTAEVWDPDAPADIKPRNKKVKINREKTFPYLDMEFYWREEELKFHIHLKENQLLKYLNKTRTHTQATFKSIPAGVLR